MFKKEPKVFRTIEEVRALSKHKFEKTVQFKTKTSYSLFVNVQKLKRKAGFFFWQEMEQLPSIGDAKTVRFAKAKKL